MICLYCQRENVADALVCAVCSRDIAVPEKLLAERDDLIEKRELIRAELRKVRDRLAAIKNPRKSRTG